MANHFRSNRPVPPADKKLFPREVSQWTAANLTQIILLTQAEYDAIDTPDPNIVYAIIP